MKKLFAIILVAVMIMSLAGCGSSEQAPALEPIVDDPTQAAGLAGTPEAEDEELQAAAVDKYTPLCSPADLQSSSEILLPIDPNNAPSDPTNIPVDWETVDTDGVDQVGFWHTVTDDELGHYFEIIGSDMPVTWFREHLGMYVDCDYLPGGVYTTFGANGRMPMADFLGTIVSDPYDSSIPMSMLEVFGFGLMDCSIQLDPNETDDYFTITVSGSNSEQPPLNQKTAGSIGLWCQFAVEYHGSVCEVSQIDGNNYVPSINAYEYASRQALQVIMDCEVL